MSEKDMQSLIDLIERHLGVAWSDVVDWLRETNSLEEIEARFQAHDIDGIVAELDTAAAHFAAATHAGYVEAGQQTAAWLTGEADALVRFDVANHSAVAWAHRNELDAITAITQDQRETIRAVIADGVERGANPREVALDLRSSIGLRPDQADAVNSYRRALENQQYADALGRQLSDGRSDQTIAAAQRSGRPLTSDQVDLAVERYRQNQITSRATTIARTEALRVAHQGNDAALQQAIDRGDVTAEQLAGEWQPGPRTKNARPDHRTPELLAQRPAPGEPFVLPDGTEMLYPGDPAGGAEHCANCRCVRAVRMTLAKRIVRAVGGWVRRPVG